MSFCALSEAKGMNINYEKIKFGSYFVLRGIIGFRLPGGNAPK